MPEPLAELPQAFAEHSAGSVFQKRIAAVQAKIQQQVGMASILTEEAKGKMRAVVDFSSSLQPDREDVLGKVGLLERSMGTSQQVTRARGADNEMVARFLGTPSEQTVIGIMRQLNMGAGFIDGNQLLELQAKLRNIDPSSPDAQTQIDEIAKVVHSQPEAQQVSRGSTAREGRSTNLSEAFAPRNNLEGFQAREKAIRERLQQIAGMSNILTDEARATMSEAVKYLDSLDIQGDKDITGKLGFLEDALGVHPPVYRGSDSRGVTRGG